MYRMSVIYIVFIVFFSQGCQDTNLIKTEYYKKIINSAPDEFLSNAYWEFLLYKEKDISKIKNNVFRLISLSGSRYDKKTFLFQKTKNGCKLEYREVLNLKNERKIVFEETLILDKEKWELIKYYFDQNNFQKLDIYQSNSEDLSPIFLIEANNREIVDWDERDLRSIIGHSTSHSNSARRIADELATFYYMNTTRE